MYGTVIGNITAVLYFFLYQCFGIILADLFFQKEKPLIRVLIGSVTGSFLLQWLPALTSSVMHFNSGSHMAALLLLTLLTAASIVVYSKKKKKLDLMLFHWKDAVSAAGPFLRNNAVITVLFVLLAVLFAVLLHSHVLLPGESGLETGQCTYGDMNMHLGFITSIAGQGMFPPDYSILPGQRLCYPFLCDSISSSLYLWGCSLKLAYCLPMMIAFLQAMGGFYAFAFAWLKDRAKSVLAWILFFFDGGFGFLYFINVIGDKTHSIQEIFTEFYHTPTNFVDNNIRWTNVVADMMLPQRATLFGWAVLFTILFLLYRANFEKKTKYFYYGGILAGGLVMIHTHSFLALGIVCAVWLFYDLCDRCAVTSLSDRIAKGNPAVPKILRMGVIFVALLSLSMLRNYALRYPQKDHTSLYLAIGLGGAALGAICILVLLVRLIVRKQVLPVLKSWGVFLAIVLPLACAQLFVWTFRQATGDRFVRGQFNWANLTDGYVTFYLKNIGLVMLFILIALVFSGKKQFRLAVSGLAIWYIAEFLGFQPNPYDNNKLLYIGFIFLLIPAASVMIDLYRKIRPKILAVAAAALVLVICTVSAVLTLGREYVSNYQLYPNAYLKIVDYINGSDIPADAVILTDNNHNNAVASLTGRNIVVGAGTFLYYHGFDITDREQDLRLMFEAPESHRDLFEKYHVAYVVIGAEERGNYQIDEAWFAENASVLCEGDNNTLLLQLDL